MTASSRPAWTAQRVRALGVRTTVPVAGEILAGLSATQAYELAKRGGFPVPVQRVGRRLVVPVAPILAFLGPLLRARRGNLMRSYRCKYLRDRGTARRGGRISATRSAAHATADEPSATRTTDANGAGALRRPA